ncbi:Calcium/calmodulin-dependent 3',5'-cyclic nucleotide phosphodiesterase 1A [Varanus komodoensis]|nr:Calcium/calmodulin-dependent 3',5'-cyclic nucleotide phosphodiesterase 1A [Varanus komodoensis]
MTQDKRGKSGIRTNYNSAKSKTCDQRAKKKLSATLFKGGKWCVPCRSLLDTEDELCNIQWDSMPVDVREWLTGTFAKKKNPYRNNLEETASVRAISYTVHTGVSVERKFRANTSSVGMAYSLEVVQAFKIPLTCLVSFAKALEVGYNKYQNPYHNSVHATDVTQTVHSIMLHTGIMHKFTDLEILAIFFSTSIHDYEHTGTTNHFHVETRSETALLYNDKSVLENHHVSAAYHLMENADMNILASLTKDEWREHKDKIMSMIVHVADISHPAKPWVLHEQWARALMEEFFKQGDREAALGLQISSLCDRQTTNIAESQIGFIDVIVKPIFALLLEALNIIVAPLIQAAAKSQCVSSSKSSRYEHFFFSRFKLALFSSDCCCPCRKTSTGVRKDEKKENPNRPKVEHPTCSERQLLATLKKPSFREHLMLNIQANRNKWKESQVTTAKGMSNNTKIIASGLNVDLYEVSKLACHKVFKAVRTFIIVHLYIDEKSIRGFITLTCLESPGPERNKVEDQVHKDKAEEKSPQETSKGKQFSSYCVVPPSTTCHCQLCNNSTFEPMDISFIVYNASSSELLQPHQDADAMDVTESYGMENNVFIVLSTKIP